VFRPVLVAAGTAAVILAAAPLDFVKAGWVFVGSLAVVTVWLLFAVRYALAREPQPDPRIDVTGGRKIWLRAALPLMVVSGLEDLLIYSDVLLLGIMLPPEDVSIYFAATRALGLANLVHYSFYFVSARGFAKATAAGDRAQLQQAVWATTRATFWFTSLAVAATLAIGPWLLRAFGPDFGPGYPVMLVLAVGLVVRSLAGQSAELLVSTGYHRDLLTVGVAAFVFNLSLSLLLIPRFGILGAAGATTLAMLARTCLLITAVNRSCGLGVLSLGLPVRKVFKTS
jgi:O-antigen/teichoic acid export membrane protein